MNASTIPSIAIDSYLKLARIPLDLALRVLPTGGNGRAASAELAVDRIDATLRTIAGSVLGDQRLREDAERRAVAAEERAKAIRLHTAAERETDEADTKLADQHQRAERERGQAKTRAAGRRQQASHRRDERVRQAAKTEGRRREANRRTKAKVNEAVESRARRARLDALETKAEALEEKDEALTAADEAKRLGDAAARTKAARKS